MKPLGHQQKQRTMPGMVAARVSLAAIAITSYCSIKGFQELARRGEPVCRWCSGRASAVFSGMC